jgi:hypothetical protein
MSRLFLKPISSVGICIGCLFFLLNELTYGQGGGSAEELMLPIFMGSTYEIVRYFGPKHFVNFTAEQLNPSSISGEVTERRVPAFFRLGLFVGVTVLVKINLSLFPAAVTAFLFVSYFMSNGVKGLSKAILRITAGGLAVATPCLLYFWETKSFTDFWKVYIDFNITYAAQGGNSASATSFSEGTATVLFLNAAAVLCLTVGAICFFFNRKKLTLLGQIGLVVGFGVLCVSAFAPNRPYPIYFIPLLSYTGLAEIVIVLTVQQLLLQKRQKMPLSRVPGPILFTFWLIAILIVAISNGAWSDTRWVRTEKTQTERIAEVILETWQPDHPDTSPNILLFYSGDIGFYQLTRCVPALRYRPVGASRR